MGYISEAVAAIGLIQKIYSWFNKRPIGCKDYYYEEFNKKIYLRKNGNGLIVDSFKITVVDPTKTNNLIRSVDIRDSKKGTKFPSFKLMQRTPIDKIFSDYGFWFKSENDIITRVEEYYEDVDSHLKKNKRFISFKFTLDTAKLEKGHSYTMGYAISVPGLFPIENGRFDVSSYKRSEYEDFKSFISTLHIGNLLRFSAYFENGIEFSEKPCGFSSVSAAVKIPSRNKKPIHKCIYKENILYSKYHFELKKPQNYTNIYMKWNLLDP